MASSPSIGAIILAGGKSARMGQDKGLMLLHEKPMIQYILDTVQKVTDDIRIVANDSAYSQFGIPVFKDDFEEKGPLGGMYTGLKNSGAEYNLILSCDIPFMHERVLEQLIESCAGYDITVAWASGKIHPLVAVYRKTCLPVIEKNIHAHELKVMKLIDALQTCIIHTEDFLPENFHNINSPQDL